MPLASSSHTQTPAVCILYDLPLVGPVTVLAEGARRLSQAINTQLLLYDFFFAFAPLSEPVFLRVLLADDRELVCRAGSDLERDFREETEVGSVLVFPGVWSV